MPSFFGPEGSELIALENFSDLNGLLAYRDLRIDELILSERFSWQLTLTNGIRLNLGREERVKRVQRFMDVYPLINTHLAEQEKQKNNRKKQLKQAVDYIDLRYDTGLAVGWKQATNMSVSMDLKKQQKSSHIVMIRSRSGQNYFSTGYQWQTKELTLNV